MNTEQLRGVLRGIANSLDASATLALGKIKREIDVCVDYLDGMDLKKIAKKYRPASVDTVRRVVRRYGCPPRYRRRSSSNAKDPRP